MNGFLLLPIEQLQCFLFKDIDSIFRSRDLDLDLFRSIDLDRDLDRDLFRFFDPIETFSIIPTNAASFVIREIRLGGILINKF